jgi:hypothetical protein
MPMTRPTGRLLREEVRSGSGGGVAVVMVVVSFLVARRRQDRGAEPIHHETAVSGTRR